VVRLWHRELDDDSVGEGLPEVRDGFAKAYRERGQGRGIVENVHIAGLGLLCDFGEIAFVAAEQGFVSGKFRKQIPVTSVDFGDRTGSVGIPVEETRSLGV
jgi:hypothetical protein